MRFMAVFFFAIFMLVAGARAEHLTGVGENPKLPDPDPSLIPTVHVAPAKGWASGVTPTAAPGFQVNAFATHLDHPRWLYVLPNGDILVAETNAPPRSGDGKGLVAWFKGLFMSRARAKTKSANRITLLRDADADGNAEIRKPFITELNSPFGMALIGQDLYVANTDAVLRFPYKGSETEIRERGGCEVVDLPAGTTQPPLRPKT